MFDAIVAALRKRSDLLGWTARHVTSHGAQLYSVPDGLECVRGTSEEHYVVDVLRDTSRGDEAAVGSGNVTILPGDDYRIAIDSAVLRAGLVRNRPYGLPGPAPLPDVPLSDAALGSATPGGATPGGHMEAPVNAAYAQLCAAAESQPGVRMTAAELFAERSTTHLWPPNGC
jgi:hypothetical protein